MRGITLSFCFDLLWCLFLILLPFGHFPYLTRYLGEFAFTPSLYVLSILIIYIIIESFITEKCFWPKSLLFSLFTLFCIWTTTISLISIYFLPVAEYKGEIIGLKSLKQVILLFFCWFTVYVVQSHIIDINKLRQTLKALFYICGGVVCYGVLQLVCLFHPDLWITRTFCFIEKMFSLSMVETSIPYIFRAGRLNLTTMEASTAGDFIAVMCIPLFLYFLIGSKSKRNKCLSGIILLTSIVVLFYTGSRTGYVTGTVVLFMGLYFYLKYSTSRKSIKTIVLLLLLLTSITLAVSDNNFFSKYSHKITSLTTIDLTETTSMSTRYGSMITSLNIFEDYPIMGIGLGNTGFLYVDYMPTWLRENPEVIQQINSNYWQDSKSLWFRVLVETGIIGFAFFGCTIFLLVYKIYKNSKRFDQEIKNISLLTVLSLTAIILDGFCAGSLRMIHWFFVVGIGIVVENLQRSYLEGKKYIG